jgi:hypothetical protein
MHFVYGGKLDGAFRPMEGYPISLALSILEDGSVERAAMRDAIVIDRWTRTVMEDGRALLIRQHGTDEAGKVFVNSGLCRRVV